MSDSAAPVVRPARLEDVAGAALVHVRSWQETYRGLFSDAILDEPGFLPRRERFWHDMLTPPRNEVMRAAVAERDGRIVGIALAGPLPEDPQLAGADVVLWCLYLLAGEHGSGAGTALLDAVIAHDEAAALWVADRNPRAQAFYRKSGFVADGTVKVEEGVRELLMRRPAR